MPNKKKKKLNLYQSQIIMFQKKETKDNLNQEHNQNRQIIFCLPCYFFLINIINKINRLGNNNIYIYMQADGYNNYYNKIL